MPRQTTDDDLENSMVIGDYYDESEEPRRMTTDERRELEREDRKSELWDLASTLSRGFMRKDQAE